MVKKSIAHEAYHRFVGAPGWPQKDIGPQDAALLDAVLAAAASGAPMTVLGAISLEHLGSRATLHKRLQRLRGEQYLSIATDAADRRLKHLLPAPRGRQYAQAIGQRIVAAAAAASNHGSVPQE
jgi:hypothetical protein